MPCHFLKRAVFFFGFVLSCFLPVAVSAHHVPSLIDRSLVQAPADPKVYLIQDGRKRWVVSEQAFLAQGLRWSDITRVDAERLAEYPEGAEIAASPFLGLVVDRSQLPDLAPVAPYGLRFAVENGRTRLRFTATFWNQGKGALELRTNAGVAAGGDESFSAFQRLFRADGTFSDGPVGTLFWHDIHQHYHYDNFGSYVLEQVRPASGAASIGLVETQKTTFCMRDDEGIGAPSEGIKQPRKYIGCKGQFQGVSVGWADVYPSTLADQFIDVTGLPAGVYRLTFTVDPNATFIESRRDNNVSATLVELDPAARTLKILASASAYASPNNRFPDGMLIRAKGDARVYVMRANKKRWLPEQAFWSYGYSPESVYELPAGAVAAIPNEKLVRVLNTGPIYVLNEAGYRRRILNPEILASYGWTGTDVAIISQAELDAYPQTELVMRAGDARVFSIREKRAIGTSDQLRTLGYAPESVHMVNATDFQALLGPVAAAQNLNIPWDIGFLPDGDMLVTERVGTLRRIGRQNAVMEVPGVLKGGEGGLMGIAIDPNFTGNHFIYLYSTTDQGGKKNRVVRFRLEGSQLILDKVILDNIPSAIYHDGGQVDFGPDGKLYIATGDATQPDLAQDVGSLAGKILRLNSDGSIPSDNPFRNAVWSYGHRNPQGFAWDRNGRMYAAEHGPTGDLGLCCRDEVNRIEKGGNYGWPVITGDQQRAGMIAPILTSGASATWAPSGITYVGGKLFFSGLRGSALYQATVDDAGGLSSFKTFLPGVYGRIRASVLGPDGFLYLTTSNRDGRGTVRTGDDKILKVSPDFFAR